MSALAVFTSNPSQYCWDFFITMKGVWALIVFYQFTHLQKKTKEKSEKILLLSIPDNVENVVSNLQNRGLRPILTYVHLFKVWLEIDFASLQYF